MLQDAFRNVAAVFLQKCVNERHSGYRWFFKKEKRGGLTLRTKVDFVVWKLQNPISFMYVDSKVFGAQSSSFISMQFEHQFVFPCTRDIVTKHLNKWGREDIHLILHYTC